MEREATHGNHRPASSQPETENQAEFAAKNYDSASSVQTSVPGTKAPAIEFGVVWQPRYPPGKSRLVGPVALRPHLSMSMPT